MATRKQKELARDPQDLVLTGRGTKAQELKRDPGDLYSNFATRPKKKHKRRRHKAKPNAKAPLGQGGRFAALEQNLSKRPGVTNPGALAAYIGRKKYGAKRFASLGR
jgi:hypothetical protein